MAKKRKAKKKSTLRKAISITAKLFVIGFLLLALAGSVYILYLTTDTEPVSRDSLYERMDKSSFIYDADGKEIDKLFYTEDRELVDIENVPEHTKNAFIAIEDKTFYKHHGFNFKRMAGAVIAKLTGRASSIGGTSTITQQLARNVYLPDIKSQRTVKRKLIEMIYAAKIERAMTKPEIMEAYLNTIYLGYGNYGIDSAAHSYFSKKVSDLSLAESAALAALPQAPDEYALIKDEDDGESVYLKKYKVYANDASKDRRDLVLSLMKDQGYITADEEAASIKAADEILKPGQDNSRSSEYTYFADYVTSKVAEDLAKEYALTDTEAERLVYTGGLEIHTTIEPEIQKVVNKEFRNDNNFPYSEEKPQASMVITEVGTGKILAMSGGRGAKGKKLFNRAVSPRQPGSSIKPLSVYSAALQKSFDLEAQGRTYDYTDFGYDRQGITGYGDYITASSLVTDEKMVIGGNVWPKNATRTYSGRRNFRTALQQSINTCAVKIQLQVGADYSVDMLKKYGISTLVDDVEQPVNDVNSAALALGAMTYGATPLDMSLAYGAFPGGGARYLPLCYTEVKDSDGKVLLKGESEAVDVLDPGVAWIMTDVLKSVVSRGIAYNAAISGTEVGGKTGTTNDTADFWFCGFTPKYSAALWIGTDHNGQMSGSSSQAALLWSEIMRQVPGVTSGEYMNAPEDVTQFNGEYYTEGTEPTSGYTINAPRKERRSDDYDNSSNQSTDEWYREWSGGDSSSSSSSSSGSSSNSGDESVDEWYENFMNE